MWNKTFVCPRPQQGVLNGCKRLHHSTTLSNEDQGVPSSIRPIQKLCLNPTRNRSPNSSTVVPCSFSVSATAACKRRQKSTSPHDKARCLIATKIMRLSNAGCKSFVSRVRMSTLLKLRLALYILYSESLRWYTQVPRPRTPEAFEDSRKMPRLTPWLSRMERSPKLPSPNTWCCSPWGRIDSLGASASPTMQSPSKESLQSSESLSAGAQSSSCSMSGGASASSSEDVSAELLLAPLSSGMPTTCNWPARAPSPWAQVSRSPPPAEPSGCCAAIQCSSARRCSSERQC
mmetsp:Transcript_154119/g.492885  ORF Transcript_154119/g.492885 Transcript_154119/m.492885 type:complete len:289 (-) Transcript_154119:284-1150(-)